MDELNITLSDSYYNQVKLLCLTETWASEASVYSSQIDGLHLGAYYCRSTFKAGGVAVFVKNDLHYKSVDLQKFTVEKIFEGCALSLKMHNSKIIMVVVCYRSPSSNVEAFLTRLNDTLNSLYNSV